MQAGDKFNLEVHEDNPRQAQKEDSNGEATANLQEVHDHNPVQAQERDFNGEATTNLQEVHKHHKRKGQTRDMGYFSKLLVPPDESTTAAQNADEIPRAPEFQNEGFLHGTSQQLLPLIQPNVNNVTQRTSAPSNFTCVTNVPYKGSLFQKGKGRIPPVFDSSDQDEEDSLSDQSHSSRSSPGGYSGDNEQSDVHVPQEDPEGVDLGSSDSCSDQGDSSTSTPGGYSGDNEESDLPVSQHDPEGVDMGPSDFPVPQEDRESVDMGSSDSCSDQGDSSTSTPGGYSGDNEESDFPVPQEDPEAVDMGSSDDGLL